MFRIGGPLIARVTRASWCDGTPSRGRGGSLRTAGPRGRQGLASGRARPSASP